MAEIASLIATVLRKADDDTVAARRARRRRPPVLQVHAVPRARRHMRRDTGLTRGGLFDRPRRRGRHHVPPDVRGASASPCTSAPCPCRKAAASTNAPRRRSAAPACSSGSSSRWRWRRRSRSSARCSTAPPSRSVSCSRPAIMFVVGAVDDLWERKGGVSPPAKVAGMVLSGSVLSLLGVTMLYFRVPFASYDYVVLSPDLAPLVTVLTVVVLANAINLIDGLDGLAAGIVAIAGSAFFLYADRLFKAGLLEGSNIAPLVAIIAVGVCVGFLPHNFNPARIFMGDAGAMFLGLAHGDDDDHRRRSHRRPVQRADLLLLRAAVHPDRDPRGPDHRHRLLVLPARLPAHRLPRRRQGPPAPPAHAARPRPPARTVHPLAVDGVAVGARPAPHVHEPGERHRPARGRCPGPRSSTSCSIPASGRPGTPPSIPPTPPRLGEDVVDLAARRQQQEERSGT